LAVILNKEEEEKELGKIIKQVCSYVDLEETSFNNSITFYQQDTNSLQALINVR